MVRNLGPSMLYEGTPRPVVAVGNDYPPDFEVAPHQHRRYQLLYGASGVMMVSTEHGAWVVPPAQGVWIPFGIQHSVRTIGPVTTNSIFIEPDAIAGMPPSCSVLGISPLMRSLLLAAIDLPLEYEIDGRDGLIMALLLEEVRRLPILPLSLPLPDDRELARRCRRFIKDPTPHETIDDWAENLGLSRRSFTRLFKRETGMSFAAWQRQACLFSALPRLVAREPITRVALDLGYESPAAFTTMFRKALGMPPSEYVAAHQ
ncbi:AraC family transcriptional regulator [Dongia deserti]|uniref:AraC family transcriptional regulator n=1 Tax=Dongia deserti TaxID=2268030 RepID=UPI000E653146|nr:helix-turn-helix transcriptional regulator [Dongia deserti]